MWHVRNYIFKAHPEKNVGIAYLYNEVVGDYTNEFIGFDLWKGTLLWKKNISRLYGWNDFFYLNDSTLLVVASGLHAIHIKTGEGWDYNTITGIGGGYYMTDADVAAIASGAVVGVLMGVLTGVFVVPVPTGSASAENSTTRGLVSNTLIDSDYIYFASAEQLVKLDKQSGTIIWKHTFQDNFTGNSSIFTDESTVYLVNKGYAYRGNQQFRYGKPFIAAYEKQTGKQKYLKLTKNQKYFIIDYKVIDNELCLLSKYFIEKYDLKTGTLLVDKLFPNNYFGELQSFIDNKVFVLNNKGSFKSVNQNDATKLHIYTTLGKIFSLNDQLNLSNTIEQANTGIYYLSYKDYKFIINKGKTFIINDEGIKVAELNVSSNAFIVGDYLYDKKDRSFFAVDLKEVIH